MLEYVFVDNSSDWAITVDGHIPVLALPVVALYAGGGFTSYHHDPDQGDASWNTGGNVLVRRQGEHRAVEAVRRDQVHDPGKDGVVFTLGTRFHLFD